MNSNANPKEIVLSFLNALNEHDLEGARGHISDNVSFTAPDGAPVRGAEAYMDGWKPLGLKYAINKTFADGNDVCVLYDISFSKQGVTLFACGLYRVDGGKVSSIKVVFDPRPLFGQQK
ncbi:SnoaL-like domain protein [uncultured archaeon]|nr:SnoaL-like domain protein [uncultured archaeon]